MMLLVGVFEGDGDHRELHGLTHSFPTRRSSDLEKPLSNLEMWNVGVKSNYVAAWHAAQIMASQKSGLIIAISGFAAVTYTYGVIFGPSRSEEHTSELQSLMRKSYAVFCLKIKTILTLPDLPETSDYLLLS